LNEHPDTTKQSDESSVLTSLAQLMDIEGQRILAEKEAENAAREREAREIHAARAASEERARRQREAQEERHRELELKRRLEDARVTAVHQATVERARREADFAESQAKQAHADRQERERLEVRERGEKRRLTRWLFVLAGVAVVIASGAALWVQERSRASRAEASRLRQEAQIQEKKRTEAERELAIALQVRGQQDQDRIAALKAKLRSLADAPNVAVERVPAKRPRVVTRPAQPVKPPVKEVTCSEGDPMCADLGGG